MRRRSLLLVLLLIALSPASRSADAVSIKIREFGLENVYASNGGPTLVSFDVRNTTMQGIPTSLTVDEVSITNDSNSVTTSIDMAFQLLPGEERTFRVPLQITPPNNESRLVLYIEARGQDNLIIGRTARLVGPKIDGRIMGLICSTPELCRTIQQSILLSGTAEEQTYKSQTLRLIQLTDPPSESWAYAPANVIILAAPVARFSPSQLEALELFVRNGGTLVFVEDQVADTVSRDPGTNPALTSFSLADANRMNRNLSFLERYRRRSPFGHSLLIGNGRVIRVPSVTSKEFSAYTRPLGFSVTTPEETRRQFPRKEKDNQGADFTQTLWLMKRLGTTFKFPGFLEILLWMIGYILVVGAVNFVLLRRLGKPELGWLTIPAIAICASILIYVTSARHRPRNYNLDDMVVYHMDDLSSLATAQARMRVSSPRRSSVEPVVPAEWIYDIPARGFRSDFVDFAPARQFNANVQSYFLDRSWRTRISLRKWSFTDLDFFSSHRFAGTVSRDSAGRLHNDTGISFQQAIVADKQNVYLLGAFPSGAAVQIDQLPHLDYAKESGHSINRVPEYPGPPFPFVRTQPPEGVRVFVVGNKRIEEEWDKLATQPFSLVELLRGWPTNGDDVFSETKAVFFGLSNQATLGSSLEGVSPERKSASLTIVTFGTWP
jgi:hypothetical protein